MDSQARFRRDDQPEERRLIVQGEIDLGVADDFIDAMTDLIRGTRQPVVVDLSRVTFFNSTGLKVLEAAVKDAEWTGVRLVIRPSTAVRRFLDLLDISGAREVTPGLPFCPMESLAHA